MRFLPLFAVLFVCSSQAAPPRAAWGTECGEIRKARTYLVKSTPVIYLQVRQGSFVLDPGEYDRGFGLRLELIGQLVEHIAVCLTGYRVDGMMIPHKANTQQARLAQRRQQAVLTEPVDRQRPTRQQRQQQQQVRQQQRQQQQPPRQATRTQRFVTGPSGTANSALP